MDSALDDFLKRFGDPTADPSGTARPKVQPVSSLKAPEGVKMAETNITADGKGLMAPEALSPKKGFDMDKAEAIGGVALDAVPDAMGLLSNAKGGQFDTSAEGGGVARPGGAILQGAAQGAKIGQVGGPLGMAIGAAVGGGISTIAHTSAVKEYNDNRVKFNIKEDAMERAESKETYQMSEGLASLEGLKALREKQLGLIS